VRTSSSACDPDVVAFGKKTHVCGDDGRTAVVGEIDGPRLRHLLAHQLDLRRGISSTWCAPRVMLEVIESEHLIPRAGSLGQVLLRGLEGLAERHPAVSNARGRGLFCAIDLPDTASRDEVTRRLFSEEDAFVLGCGVRSIRFRPPLTITVEELHDGLERLERVIDHVTA
jgi:L-lysine 6-transaminase